VFWSLHLHGLRFDSNITKYFIMCITILAQDNRHTEWLQIFVA